MEKTKPLIVLGGMLLGLAVFFFCINIVVLTGTAGKTAMEIQALSNEPGFINYLISHPKVYGLAIVLPLCLVFAASVACFVFGILLGRKLDKKANEEQNEEIK